MWMERHGEGLVDVAAREHTAGHQRQDQQGEKGYLCAVPGAW